MNSRPYCTEFRGTPCGTMESMGLWYPWRLVLFTFNPHTPQPTKLRNKRRIFRLSLPSGTRITKQETNCLMLPSQSVGWDGGRAGMGIGKVIWWFFPSSERVGQTWQLATPAWTHKRSCCGSPTARDKKCYHGLGGSGSQESQLSVVLDCPESQRS